MFKGCSSLENLEFGDNFNTAKVTDMYGMFKGCSSLENLKFGKNFNTSNVKNKQYMFDGCSLSQKTQNEILGINE